jgi:citrate synthase
LSSITRTPGATIGSVFVGSIEGAAKLLKETLPAPDAGADFDSLADGIVSEFMTRKATVPGIGHPIYKPIDPRTPRLFELAEATNFNGSYLRLMSAVAAAAERRTGKLLPVNATGAIGALCCEMGFDWKISRGLGVMARAVGLIGHILEESR